MFNIGLVSVSFRQHSALEIINECKKAGIDTIEWGSDIHAFQDDVDALLKLADLQKEQGIKCSSYGTYFRVGENKPTDIYPYIKAAKILDTDTLRIWCGNKDYSKYTAQEKAQIIEQCKQLAAIAEQEEVKLCTEFHPNTYTVCKQSVLSLLNAVDSKSFRTYWQPNQYESVEENLSSAEALAPYVENVHVFNWKGNEKFPLIEGKAVWRDYLSKLNGEHNLLLEFMPDGDIKSLAAEAEALRTILGGL